MKFKVLNIFFLIIPFILHAQESRLSLIFAGDLMGHDSQIESAKEGDSYNYDTCFTLLKPYLEKADIAIANLEVTLAGPPYKGYPQFSSPDALAQSALDAGFDLFITANNHSLDRGKKGLERTLDVLEEKDFIYTGTFKDSRVRVKTYPLIIEKNNIRLAILNYTYGTNGLKVQEPNIVNYIDTAVISKDILRAKLAEPDFIIVTVHWGLEYQRIQNKQQENLAMFMLKEGADAIIGSHPHVVQPVKTYMIDEQEKLVVYCLGNFISNQRERYRDGGILVEMELVKNKTTDLSSYSYLPFWVYKPKKEKEGHHFILVPSNQDRSYYTDLKMKDSEFEKMKIFQDDTSEHLKGLKYIKLIP